MRTLAADPPRASSLVVTVWGDAVMPLARDGGLWLRALIALMAPFGVNERATRTSVYRLAKDGWLAGRSQGRETRYRLTPAGRTRFTEAYRRIYAPHNERWDDAWELVVMPPEALPPARRNAVRETLQWAGFGALAPGVLARPALGGRGLPDLAVAERRALTVLAARESDSDDDDDGDGDGDGDGRTLASAVGTLWPLADLAARYRRFLDRFGAAPEHFRDVPDSALFREQCFVARTLLIHAYRRALLRDPLLPAALLPLDWPGAAAYALARDVYRLVRAPADAHVAATLGDANGRAPGDDTPRFP